MQEGIGLLHGLARLHFKRVQLQPEFAQCGREPNPVCHGTVVVPLIQANLYFQECYTTFGVGLESPLNNDIARYGRHNWNKKQPGHLPAMQTFQEVGLH